MPSRTSQNPTGASGSKQCVKPTKTAKTGHKKETRHDHEVQALDHEQPAHRGEGRYSAAVNRWLDEPAVEGPYNGIAGVVGWERYGVTDGESIDAGERKKREKDKKDKKSKHR